MLRSRPNELTFEAIQERDTSVLLMEELACSKEFQEFFLQMIVSSGGTIPAGSIQEFKSFHSLPCDGREFDLVVRATVGTPAQPCRLLLLIENKLDAQFQPDQPQFYRQSAIQAREGDPETREVDAAVSVLFAPAGYQTTHPECEHFDAFVSYEQVRDFLAASDQSQTGDSCARRRFRAEMLDQAIGKYRRGPSESVPDDLTTSFWQLYYERACRTAPQLQMARPTAKPRWSVSVPFPLEQRKPFLGWVSLYHETNGAKVEIRIANWADHFESVVGVLKLLVPPHFQMAKSGKSFALRINTPRIDIKQDFAAQCSQVDKALAAAVELRTWYNEHLDDLVRLGAACSSDLTE